MPTHKPRLNVEIREDQFKKMQEIIPYGTRRILFERLIDDLIDFIGDRGYAAIAEIQSGEIRLRKVDE